MLILVTVVALTAIQPAAKALPPIAEPNWETWQSAAPDAKRRASEAWATLCSHRPEREYKTEAEQQQAERSVDAAYKTLEAIPQATCAAGASLMRNSKDDWERIMIASTIKQLEKDKGEPFLVWALARATKVDATFEPVFYSARELASKRRPEYLPAVFSMLHVHDGQLNLPLHAWAIPSSECLAYVFLSYGRDVIPYLYPMLKHDDPFVRNNAAIVLGYFMDRNAKPALLEMLRADDVGSAGAAFALGQLGAEDTIKPITQMLGSLELRSRFCAAHALYEIGSTDALPALEAAISKEKHEDVRNEMRAAIEHLLSRRKPLDRSLPKQSKAELQQALDEAERANGLQGDIESISASAGRENLKQLEQIRLQSTHVMSDLGNKWFRRWTQVIKSVSRRAD